MKKTSRTPFSGHRPPTSYYIDNKHPYNHHYYRHENHRSSPSPSPPPPSSNYRPYRHTQPPVRPAKFVIQLCSVHPLPQSDLESLISTCEPPPENSTTTATSASLIFRQWCDALAAFVHFWKLRLEGAHEMVPRLSKVPFPSDEDKLRDQMKTMFSNHIKNNLLEGELVKNWQRKLDKKLDEMADVSNSMKGKRQWMGLTLMKLNELNEKKEALAMERNLIAKRVREFKAAMSCLLLYLEGKNVVEEKICNEDSDGVRLFSFDGEADNWERVYRLILRECRRLEDGLPIYASRQEILREIHRSQIMVLIGETGSGKSTQLVQFLADSGIAADKSIVCTQPRKLAAISLARRVSDESSRCLRENSVICFPTFSSSQQFDSKVIYMTDHCLLQHYMNDRKLSGISCIIVDEAHERSLNTDLLLALVKELLIEREDLRLVIMSATADAKQLSDYFFGCGIIHVPGRNFPVDIQYVPCAAGVTSGSGVVASYVSDVVRMANDVHKTEKDGTILAFLTSQMEVEWACENFEAANAVALPLHGKLSFDEQFRVFQNFDGKRKVIFATNLAETSLTIPGVKFVIDSGLVKESKFEPGSGMNVLKVCWISQSSANQRAGRAGRTEPGRCYRLYAEHEFESMSPNQEPEIRRVHLGIAVLRILALGIKNVDGFGFIDAPSAKAIELATRNLVQLGAIELNNSVYELTEEGRGMVKLGIEPRLGKLILSCNYHRLCREGVVLAAVMANSSSIFCRVGSDNDKQKADCLKVQFCHHSGDLFTLLSVYKEWEDLPRDRKNKWCWENSINAKTMRRCEDTVKELENCLEKELNIIVTGHWYWNPQHYTNHDECLKKIILSALSENVAMYTGYNQFGYQVALTGQHVQLHPSCSLLAFGQKPSWVVFGELLSIKSQYLVCVTAFNFDSLSSLCPSPLFNVSDMECRKLQVRVMTGFGSTFLKRFCGKFNSNLLSLVSRVRAACMDERIGVEVKVDRNEILLFASLQVMEKAFTLVNDALENEQKWLHNECMEKCLYNGAGISPTMALFGAGAEIKHLELEKRFLTVDVFHSDANAIDDKELLVFLEKHTSGGICAVHKSTGIGQDSNDTEKWGKITFLTPDAARKAAELSGVEFCRSELKVLPGQISFGGFPAVKAKVSWPRRLSKGFAIVKCDRRDVSSMADDFFNLLIGEKFIRSEVSNKYMDSVVIGGLDRELSEAEILDVLRMATERRILDFFLVRGDAVQNPSCRACEEALLKEISPFMPRRNPHVNSCRVQVFPPEPKDVFMKAVITFDGRLHLEAARALEQLEGKVLPGCLSWQKMKCQQLFHSSVSCSASVYSVIKGQLDSLLARFNRLKGAECTLFRNDNGSFRVKISANATKTVAELRRPLEELMNGRPIEHASLTPTILRHLFSRDGINLKKAIEQGTRTCILLDRQSVKVRIFGSLRNTAVAQQRLIQGLLAYHENKQLEIHLRGGNLPPDLMKQVVKKFGPDLNGLKEKMPGADITLNAHRHVISIHGDNELRQKVEHIVCEIAQMRDGLAERPDSESVCAICLCEVEDGYRLEGCAHLFCRLCLLEQCESAIRNMDSFPICCAHEGCRVPILLSDLRTLLSSDRLEELFRASLASFVASSGGIYRFCPSPDCPSVYQVADPGKFGEPFVCGACYTETCTRCHLEYHPYLSCEKYQEFKDDPDSSLKEWCKGKEHVKHCPVCGYTIEKIDGCNHVECKCGKHICWVCLDFFSCSDGCYDHLRSIHGHFMNLNLF